MSLSQATSPEEAKRELKQQVFLAIQGKYMPGKTTELIKDINTIAADILGDEAKELLPCVDPKPQTKLFDEVMFHCVDGDYYKPVEVDQIGTPVSEELILNSTVYYRHKVGLIDDDDYVIYWFYSHIKDLSGWVIDVKYDLWTKLRAHSQRDKPASDIRKATSQAIMDQPYNADDDSKDCDQPQAADGHKDILCIGGDVDGKSIHVPCGRIGKPLQKAIYPMNGIQKYYLHNLTVAFDRAVKTYYFYSPKQEYTDLLPRSAATALDLLIEFYKDKKED